MCVCARASRVVAACVLVGWARKEPVNIFGQCSDNMGGVWGQDEVREGWRAYRFVSRRSTRKERLVGCGGKKGGLACVPLYLAGAPAKEGRYEEHTAPHQSVLLPVKFEQIGQF